MDTVLTSLVGPDGRVSGDSWGESDTRFSYILLNALTLLGRLDALEQLYDGKGKDLVIENIANSMNFDGGFGMEPGAESHGGQGGSSSVRVRQYTDLRSLGMLRRFGDR